MLDVERWGRLPFQRAWAAAIIRPTSELSPEERRDWLTAFGATKPAWNRSYDRVRSSERALFV